MKKGALMLALGMVLLAEAAQSESAQGTRNEAREILARVIGFQTSIDFNQVPVMAEYLADKFRAAGFSDGDVQLVPQNETAALIVRYRGKNGGRPAVLLLAHMDVVTAKREEWERDPFTLVEEGGYFFGRGVLDMKGDLTQLASTFLRLKAEHYLPKRDLVLVFTGDEETSGASAADVVKNHRELVAAEFALNGDGGYGVLDEATGKPLVAMVQGAEKANVSYVLTVRNPGGHSSQPREPNAIYQLADALKAVQAYRFPVMSNEWTLKSFQATAARTSGELGEAMGRFAANPADEWAANVLWSDSQNVGRTRTTCVATQLAGGHADNALPQTATATVNCRIFPGMSLETVRNTLQRLAGDVVEVKPAIIAPVSEASPLRSDVMSAVEAAIESTYPGVPVIPDMAPFATDAAIFRAAGIPTYGISGNFIKGSDDFTHGLNERLPVASFYAGLDFYYTLLKAVGSGDSR
jgi:acetylornithine deacetylase/succinyl-diaminopimelate desuccinylase-like protein